MECNRVQIKNFRNIAFADVSFAPGVNILAGKNAQGKTNLLEAVSLAALGKSFRTSHEEDVIRFGEEFSAVSVDFSDSVRRQNITVRMQRGKRRQIEHNGIKVTKISDMVGEFRTVLFCPEHLSLIKDGPSERRSYLDVAISQLYPVYLRSLQKYHQILKQRNSLLKAAQEDRTGFDGTIELWSSQLAKEAALIARYRARYIKAAQEHIALCFAEMTNERELPMAIYDGSSHQEIDSYEDLAYTEQQYFTLLTTRYEREIGAGSTLWGIHKDDIDITINQKSARLFASQGQQRSLALAMKLAEGEVCASVCGEKPVFLLDDVFSELDESRRAYLSGRMEDRQVIITTCEPGVLTDGKLIWVENGCYKDQNQ